MAFLAAALNFFSSVLLASVWIRSLKLACGVADSAGLNLKPDLGSRKQKAGLFTWKYLEIFQNNEETRSIYLRQNVSTQGISLKLLSFNISH